MKLTELKNLIKVGDIVEHDETMRYTITSVNSNDTVTGVVIGGGQSKNMYGTIPLSEITVYFPFTPIEY